MVAAVVLLVVANLAGTPSAFAGPAPQLGYTKAQFDHPLHVSLDAFDGVAVLEVYESYTLCSVDNGKIESVTQTAIAANQAVYFFDGYDLLTFATQTVDTRVGLTIPPGARLANYQSGKFGVYALQFIGPYKQGWYADIAALGGVVIDSRNQNGALVALTPEIVAAVRGLHQVQFLVELHPFLKAGYDWNATGQYDVLVQIAKCPGTEEAIEQVSNTLSKVTETRDYYGFYIRGLLNVNLTRRVLDNPLVIGVYPLHGPLHPQPVPAVSTVALLTLALCLATIAVTRISS